MAYVVKPSLVLALLSVSLTLGCAGGGGSTGGEADTAVVLSHRAEVDTLNNVPLLNDYGGEMDSLWRAEGYLYGHEIEDRAAGGDAEAAYILAQMYAYGICGAEPDRRKAFQLYVSLADRGNVEAKAMAGYMMFYGLGAPEDTEQGMHLMADALNADSPLGTFFMALVYDHNTASTPANRASARILYQKASAMGIRQADSCLAQMSER